VRYAPGVIESYVDLTYRGLSLGRRIRLTQIRPSSGYLELAAPMPVGTPLAITSDDGVTFEATVRGVHEQVAGSDRAPGMIVAPALAGVAAAAAWWTARVALPDDEPRPRSATAGGRSRPVTVRPRSHTAPMPATGAATDEVPALAADLQARVTAAAGIDPGATQDDATAASTMVMPVLHSEGPAPAGEADATLQRTGEHDVLDDGKHTTIMESIDPAVIGIDAGAAGDGDDGDDGDGDDTDDGEADPAGEFGDQVTIPDGAGLSPGRRRKKRRSRR
jgi:hypothetical protein